MVFVLIFIIIAQQLTSNSVWAADFASVKESNDCASEATSGSDLSDSASSAATCGSDLSDSVSNAAIYNSDLPDSASNAATSGSDLANSTSSESSDVADIASSEMSSVFSSASTELVQKSDGEPESYFFFADTYTEAKEITESYDVELETYSSGVGTIVDTEGVIDIPQNGDGTLYPDEELTLDTASYYDDTDFSQWHISFLNMSNTWKKSTGSGIKVAVIDSGVCDGNSYFDNTTIYSYTNIPDEQYGDSSSQLFDEDNKGAQDNVGHGTHVIGIIAANSDDTSIRGVAPNCTIYSYKAFDQKKNGATTGMASWVASAVTDAIEAGVDIINMSIGGTTTVNEGLEAAIQLAYERGIIVVCSAGNYISGVRSTVDYPASSSYTIGVSAGYQNGSILELASYSKYGSGVDYIAPGSDILSTYFYSYTEKSGTSMAAPMVSGEIALILSILSGSSSYSSKTSRQAAAYSILQSTALDIGDSGKDIYFGYGMIRPYNAVVAALNKIGAYNNSSASSDNNVNIDNNSSVSESSDDTNYSETSSANSASSVSDASSSVLSSTDVELKEIRDKIKNMTPEEDTEMFLQDENNVDAESGLSDVSGNSSDSSIACSTVDSANIASGNASSSSSSGEDNEDRGIFELFNGTLEMKAAVAASGILLVVIIIAIVYFFFIAKRRKDKVE